MKYLFALLLLFLACNTNKNSNTVDIDKLEQEVLSSIKKEFSETRKAYKPYKLSLVHKSGNEYSGILETLFFEKDMSLSVVVLYDGEKIMWQVNQY